jgi:hypothetical protein
MQAFPESAIRFKGKLFGFEIVPVVYIQNKVFQDKDVDVLDLAQKTYNFIGQINTKNQITCKEIQIDCDWTLSTKDNYLKFVEHFKRLSDKRLSATIRLHQVKYFQKTKIPNVDKGVLMFYNMGEIAPDSLNSIYDRNISKRYLSSLKNYPLSLNIALPVYSWGIHIRDERVIGLKNKVNPNDFKNDSNYFFESTRKLLVKNSNYKHGTFYKRNDYLKLESISADNLLEMAKDLENHLASSPQEIIFYDLDEFNTKHYEKSIFEQVIARF